MGKKNCKDLLLHKSLQPKKQTNYYMYCAAGNGI